MESIIGKTIKFNRQTAPVTFDSNSDYNVIFLRSIRNYLNDVLIVTRFLSWETICNALGLSLDPDEIENTYVHRYKGKGLEFLCTRDAETDGYIIKICEEKANG